MTRLVVLVLLVPAWGWFSDPVPRDRGSWGCTGLETARSDALETGRRVGKGPQGKGEKQNFHTFCQSSPIPSSSTKPS